MATAPLKARILVEADLVITRWEKGGSGWQATSLTKGTPHTCEMKAPWTDPVLRELVALAALSAFGCGLAFAQGDILFVAIFAAASAIVIVEALRRPSMR
jgi:hypothetical protein